MALSAELAHLARDNEDQDAQFFVLYPTRAHIPDDRNGLADRFVDGPTQLVLPHHDAVASWAAGGMTFFCLVPRRKPVNRRWIEVIDHYWCLWVDLDDLQGLERVEARLRPLDFWPSAIVSTGNQGFHLYFRLNFSLPVALIELYNQALAALVGGDQSNPPMPSTCLRVPGTVNETSCKTVELVELSGATYGPDSLRNLNAALLPTLEPIMVRLQRRRDRTERYLIRARRIVAAAERRLAAVEQREARSARVRQRLDRKLQKVEEREDRLDRIVQELGPQNQSRWRHGRLRWMLSRAARAVFPNRAAS
jgi:hypothetical protein